MQAGPFKNLSTTAIRKFKKFIRLERYLSGKIEPFFEVPPLKRVGDKQYTDKYTG